MAIVIAQVLTALPALTALAAEFTPLGYFGKTLSLSADGRILLLYKDFEYFLLEDGVLTPVSSLPGFPTDARPVDMSADGQVIAGNTDGDGGFVWSDGVTTYLTVDGTAFASALSGDGTTVAGRKAGGLTSWRAGTLTTLPSIVDPGDPGAELDQAWVHDISHDGSVVVGYNRVTTNRCYQCDWALRWDDGVVTRLDDLLVPPAPDPDVPELKVAYCVSDDGQVTVGSVTATPTEPKHFRLDPSGVGYIDETARESSSVSASQITDVSWDGSRIVGRRTLSSGVGGAGLWDVANGPRFVADVLLEDFGVAVPAGYELITVILISADGRTLVGRATPPGGGAELWIATLESAPAVPALTPVGGGVLALLLAGSGAWCVTRPLWQRERRRAR